MERKKIKRLDSQELESAIDPPTDMKKKFEVVKKLPVFGVVGWVAVVVVVVDRRYLLGTVTQRPKGFFCET
jgi:hypothetical protein